MAPPAPSLEEVIHQIHADAHGEEPLARLRAASDLVRDLADVGDAALGYFVDQARRAGHSWSEIGEALGVSKQAAQQKHTVRDYLGPHRPTFERFTPRARNVLAGAETLARQWGLDGVDTEHLLLALYGEPEGIAARILEESGLPAGRAGEMVAGWAPRGTGSPPGQLPFTARAKAVLSEALASALELGHNYIGTEHILLGLVGAEGLAVDVLTDAGLDRESLTAKVQEKLGPYLVSPGAKKAAPRKVAAKKAAAGRSGTGRPGKPRS